MKRELFFGFIASLAVVGCTTQSPVATVISEGLKFCEGSITYGASTLVTNFGADELNPLNSEGKGYVMQINGDKTEVFIPNDGSLSAPKGMAIQGDYLYIADVGKVVVYNLKERNKAPQTISMPDDNVYVNDIAISGQVAYISVTNTGKIFKLDITTPEALDVSMLSEYANVVGANGLFIEGNKMYVASYPANGTTTSDNVIYVINDITTPTVEKLITREGQYDGVATYEGKLYFTNWVNGEVGYVDLKTNEVKLVEIKDIVFKGAADITIKDGVLYIPDLPSSVVVAFPLK